MPKVVNHDQRRAELVAATWEVVADEGVEGATLRRIAEVAGCTTGRVTHYFENKDQLLLTAFERVGKAYLRFARDEPASYSAMFESGLPVDANPKLLAASERAFGIIRAAAERLAALAPPGTPRPPAMMMALHIWSMSHGVASLFARGDAARRKLPMSAEELLEAEVLIYLRGLGFLADRRAAASDSTDPKPSGRPSGPWGSPK